MTIPLQARTVVRPPAGRRRVRLAMICGLLAAPVLAAPALGETVEATGQGQALVKVSGPLSQAKIARAVGRARGLAVPRAFTNATIQAGLYAAAGGLTLGAVQAIEEPPPSPFGFYGPVLVGNGRFGPNQYCGKITTAKRRLVNGRRRVVSRTTRFRCFKPETIAVSLYVSFAASPAPVAPTS